MRGMGGRGVVIVGVVAFILVLGDAGGGVGGRRCGLVPEGMRDEGLWCASR